MHISAHVLYFHKYFVKITKHIVLKKNNTIEERRKELDREKLYSIQERQRAGNRKERLRDKAIKNHGKFIKVTTSNNPVTTTNI